MTHPFEWKRSQPNFLTTIKKMAEKKFPGNSKGEFVAPDGSVVKKNSRGEIFIKGVRNTRGITLKKEV